MIAPDLLTLARPIDSLHLLPGNPRKGDVEAVARSLQTFGQRKPITALPDGTVTAGNHTLLAARSLGWTEIAVSVTDDDEATAKAWALADNRTAEMGTYDDQLLADLIGEVAELDPALLAATGWTDADLQALLASMVIDVPVEIDLDAIPDVGMSITVPGDVWLLGPHRVMCGDCRSPTDVDSLLDGATVNVAFTSPPYASQRLYDESSGFKPIAEDDYVEWFRPVADNVAAHLADDGSWFVNIKPPGAGLDTHLYVFDLVIAHVRQWGWHFGTEFCWERGGVPKQVTQRFKNQFEPIYQFAHNPWKMRPEAVRHASDNVPQAIGKGAGDTSWAKTQGGGNTRIGRPRHRMIPGDLANWQGRGLRPNAHKPPGAMSAAQGTNVSPGDYHGPGLAFPGNRLPTFTGTHTATGHAAAFPVGLPQFFVKAYSDAGDCVYDPFMGSGSTLLAAHLEKRVGYGMEISPAYVDVICRRFQTVTGIVPVAEATGNEHDFLGA